MFSVLRAANSILNRKGQLRSKMQSLAEMVHATDHRKPPIYQE